MNYLELCDYLIRRVGIAGAHQGMGSVVDATGRKALVADLIREADMDIQREWNDWTFHNRSVEYVWNRDEQFLDESKADWFSQVARFNTGSFAARTEGQRQWIAFESWPIFRDRVRGHTYSTSGIPQCITQDTSGRLQIVPTDTSFVLSADVHIKPYAMTADNSESPIPVEYRDMIMFKAAMKYSDHEEAAFHRQSFEVEYMNLLKQLESVCLPNSDRTNLSADEDPIAVVAM